MADPTLDLKIIEDEEDNQWPFDINRGLPKLVAYVRKLLLTTLGSDPNDDESGCYIKRMVGRSYNDLSDIATQVNREIKRVEKQIIRIQTNLDYNIPEEEQLRKIKLLRIYEDEDSDIWRINADFLVINQEGESYEGKLFSKES
ncbi:MAG: hypothetical protein ACOCT9_00370 [archaeon]